MNPLTKKETVALWYAVESYEYAVKAMKYMNFLPSEIEFEAERLKTAKQALRKVNALRKEGA